MARLKHLFVLTVEDECTCGLCLPHVLGVEVSVFVQHLRMGYPDYVSLLAG